MNDLDRSALEAYQREEAELLSRVNAEVNRTSPPLDCVGRTIKIGERVTFCSHGFYAKRVCHAGEVVLHRPDPRRGENSTIGWIDIQCDDGKLRSARPSACAHEIVA